MENERKLPRVNFRPFLFAALSLAFGISLYGKLCFQTFSYSDLFVWGGLLILALFPFSLKRSARLALLLVVFAGIGMGCSALYTVRYCSGKESGEYAVSGTVVSASVRTGYSVLILDDLAFDGENTGGKCRVVLACEDVRTGDRLLISAKVERADVHSSSLSDYASDIRYSAKTGGYQKIGKSGNPFLLLNGAIYDRLHDHMGKDEADVAYALLTGSSGGMDGELLDSVRRGGIAHIFAVSGLHIGIVYAAVSVCFRKCGKWKIVPALVAAVCFSALSGFSVSSLRAVLMCTVLGVSRSFGRKSDFLQSIGFAALVVLCLFPAQWYAVGFRLSFGACLGLALFSGSLRRLFHRLPHVFSEYLAATLSAQVVTFPVLIESFGYFSVWGTLLNLLIVPFMPLFFLCVLVFTLCALAIAPAATIFLAVPSGLISCFLYLFALSDFSLVLSGFALSAGSIVWIVGCVLLSERVRFSAALRSVSAVALTLLFALCIVSENVVLFGCKITSYSSGDGAAVLVQTRTDTVLLLDGDMTIKTCNDFLSRTYGGTLTAAIVVTDDEIAALNRAAFLRAKECRALDELTTGLRETEVRFGETFSYGELSFRYENSHKIMMIAEGLSVEIDFESGEALGSDLFLDGSSTRLQYFLKNGMLYTRS